MNRPHLDSDLLRVSLFAAACLTGFLVAGPVTRALAGDDPGDEMLHACYVPGSGVVYRIGADGLKDECSGKHHVMFSWNAQGPPGPRGLPGPQGPPGPPGPVLGAQTCPTGEFVTGIGADGTLICTDTSTGGSGGGGGGAASTWYLDADSDGWGDEGATTEAVEQPAGYVSAAGDCNDGDASIHPGADDPVGDGVDSDCDGFDGTAGTVVDDDVFGSCLITPMEWYPDVDQDGYGDGGAEPRLSDLNPDPGNYVENGCDCDDDDPNVNPGAQEVVDGVDNNCNGLVY